MAGGLKAGVVVVGAAAIAGIAALAAAGSAKAAAGRTPPRRGTPGVTNASSAGAPAGGGAPPPEAERTIPSAIPGVPPITIKPGDASWLANELALHLTALQLAKGGVAGARGKENKELVKAFQRAAPVKPFDGLSGPATMIAVAKRGMGTLPLVMYWPKGADQKTVAAYRTALRAIAAGAPPAVAEQLKQSADREQGQALGAANQPHAMNLPAGAVNS